MSVNWQWKDKMGTIQCSDYQGDYTLNVYSGNCLCVLTYEYIENDVEKYTFHGFFNDLDHLKICVGLKKDYNGDLKNIYKDTWVKWKLNTYFKDTLKIADALTKSGFAVELYYEVIK